MTIAVGMIGAGQIAGSCAQSLASCAGARVVAAHDLNAERLAALCAEHAIPQAYATVEELLADRGIDAVYIAVPNAFHAPLAIQALEAGKHVLLDKPFALDLDQALQVAAAARASSATFLLGMNQRYRSESQTIAQLARDGLFGDIYHAKAFWLRRQGIPKLGTWFGSKELAGGGCLLDIGVHMLDLCLFVMDKWDPVSVSGTTYTRFGNRGLGEGSWGKSERAGIPFDVDDFATALIRLADGSTVNLDVSWACHAESGSRNDVHIYGDEAGASLYPAKIFRADPLRQDYDVIDAVAPRCGLAHCDRFHNWIASIAGDEKPLTSLRQALTVQAILDGIYQSAATGAEVAIDRQRIDQVLG